MKKYYTLILVIVIFSFGKLSAVTDTITYSGYTFVPDSITINPGDQVFFNLSAMHNAVQVDKSVWDANGNTSNGGFSVAYGGGLITLNTPGTYYYVCQPHAGFGMKGRIFVRSVTAIGNTKTENGINLQAYPNPANEFLNIEFNAPGNSRIKIDLIDMTGKVVGNLSDVDYDQGNYNITVPVSDYPSGRYFVRYTYGSEFAVKPVIIEKLK
jgi:plastocyanin